MPPFVGPEHARVLYAVAGEHDPASVVELHGTGDDDRALGVAQPLGDAVVDVRVRDRLVELRDRRPVERRVELEVGERRDVLGARHRRVECIRGGSPGSPVAPPSARRRDCGPLGRQSRPPAANGAAQVDRIPVDSVGHCSEVSDARGFRVTRAPTSGRRPALPAGRPSGAVHARRGGRWGKHGSPTVCRGGSRTPMSRGTAGFKPAASDQFRHPGGATQRIGLCAPGKEGVGREPLGALELVRVEERLERRLVERRALREVRRALLRLGPRSRSPRRRARSCSPSEGYGARTVPRGFSWTKLSSWSIGRRRHVVAVLDRDTAVLEVVDELRLVDGLVVRAPDHRHLVVRAARGRVGVPLVRRAVGRRDRVDALQRVDGGHRAARRLERRARVSLGPSSPPPIATASAIPATTTTTATPHRCERSRAGDGPSPATNRGLRPGLSMRTRLRRHGAERYRRPRRFRPTCDATLPGPHDGHRLHRRRPRRLRRVLARASTGSRPPPAARERSSIVASSRSETSSRDRDVELDVARRQLVDARASAAASAARLETLEEKLPETVRSISQETLDASRDAFLDAGRRACREDAAAGRSSASATSASSSTRPRRADSRTVGGSRRSSSSCRPGRGHSRSRSAARSRAGVGARSSSSGSSSSSGWSRASTTRARRPSRAAGRTSSCTCRAGRTSSSTRRHRSTSSSVRRRRRPRRSALAALADVRAQGTACTSRSLDRKGYWTHVTPSPDFTFMFLPGDAYLAAAEEQDAELFSFAYERGVLLATPRTIVVMLRTIRVAWQNENASEHADAVLKVATELHERLTTMAEHSGQGRARSRFGRQRVQQGGRLLRLTRARLGTTPRGPRPDKIVTGRPRSR